MKRKKDTASFLFLSRRNTAAYSALLLGVLGVVFMGGYFLGKQHMVDDLIAQIEYDSFSDHITTSLLSSYDAQFDAAVDAKVHTITQNIVHDISGKNSQEVPSYYAQLIGYGTRDAAERFAEKLLEKGLPVAVKERTSVTASGSPSHWYQVVTEPFTDQNALQEVTQRIAHEENIQGVQIVSC